MTHLAYRHLIGGWVVAYGFRIRNQEVCGGGHMVRCYKLARSFHGVAWDIRQRVERSIESHGCRTDSLVKEILDETYGHWAREEPCAGDRYR
jgi:hypothetical protein